MNPGQHDMAGHLADRPRVVSVIGEPRIRSVPVGEQRRSGLHVGPYKSLDRSRGVVRDSGETDAPRPSIQVFRSFPPWLGLVCSAVDHLDPAPAIRIFPDLTGSKKLLSARKGISAWSTSTTPSSGSRWGSIIDRRSFCASNQAVL